MSDKMIKPGKWHAEFDEEGNAVNVVYEDSFRKLLGYESEKEYADSQEAWTDSIYPDDAERLDAHFRDCVSKHPEGMDYDIEYRMKTKSGFRWFHDFGYAARREDGSLARLDGVVIDIQDSVSMGEMRKEQIAKMAGGVSSYIVNPNTRKIQILYQNEHLSEKYFSEDDFDVSFASYIDRDVFEQDKDYAKKSINLASIVSKLEKENEYIVRYRDISAGNPRWYEMRAVKLSDDEILCGFTDKDDEIVEQLMYDKMRDQYFALYYINIDAGTAQIIKTGNEEKVGAKGSVVNYETLLTRIAGKASGEEKEFLESICDDAFVKENFATEDILYRIYKSTIAKGNKWIGATGQVLMRKEDGTPAVYSLGFSFLDEDASRKEEAKRKLSESMEVVGGLASEYTALYHVNLDTDCYVTYHLNEMVEDIIPYYSNNVRFVDLAHEYAESKLVHPEDTEKMKDFYPSAEIIKERLKDKKRISMLFKRNYGGKYLWTEAVIVKCEDEKEDAHNVIVGFVEKDQEVRDRTEQIKESENANRLIENVAKQYELAYIVDMAEDKYMVLRNDESVYGHEKVFESFSAMKEDFLENVVHPNDRERMRKELDYSSIRKNIDEKVSYSIEYRALLNNSSRWNEMNVTLVAGDNVAIGFSINDIGITKKHLEEKRFEEYLALFVIDLDSETIKPIKTSNLFKTANIGESVPYKDAMSKFSKIYEGDAKDFFTQICDIDYVRQQFATNDKVTYSYNSALLGKEIWLDVTGYVILRHEDQSPAITTLGFSISDALATARNEYQIQIQEDMHLIGGLASGYDTLLYINIDDNLLKVFMIDGRKLSEEEQSPIESSDIFETLRKYGQSDLIHPEDRNLFADFNADFVREKMRDSKKYHQRFRRQDKDGEYRWCEMEIIKYEDVDEQANSIALGLASCDEAIRSEQAMNNCFEILGKEMTPQDSIDSLLETVGEYYGAERAYIFEFFSNNEIFSNTYEWCKEGIEPMINLLQDIPIEPVEGWIREFNRQGAFYMDALDSEHNTEEGREILEMQGIESLIAAPIINDNSIVGFIGVDNPTKAKKNIEVMKTVAVVAYSEILKRKENDEEHITLSKLTEAFMSVYFVDLTTDYMRTWKIAEEYKDAYGKTEKYSVSMGGYVRQNIAEYDRNRCIRMTDPKYILNKFKKTDRFSIDMTDIMLGYERYFVFDYIKVNEEGTQLVICCRDVSDTLEKEREQALILDLANQQRHIKSFGDMVNAALWSIDVNKQNEVVGVYWSNELRRMFGYEENEEDFPNTIEAWTNNLHPDDLERTYTYFSEGLESIDIENYVFDIEYRVRKKNGEYCWFHSAGRMENVEGGIRRMYGILYDISAEKKLQRQQRELEEAWHEAEEANKSKTNFLFNMSHDIRTPMNAITGFTNMAKKYIDDKDKVVDYLDKIDTSGVQLLSLVNQVLEMARIESGRVEIEKNPVSIREEYDSMVVVLSEQAKTCGLEFYPAIINVKHDRILADPARLSSITLNITGNAMKYTPKGGKIDFTLKEIPARKEGYATLVFTVEDTGIGMSEEYQKILFEPFTREKSSTVSKIQGTGLGMSIVKDLVELMGGKIEVWSEIGKGTRFDVTIDFEIDDQNRQTSEQRTNKSYISFKGCKVLLVEDNELNREIAIDILKEEGFEVEEADDGTVAVDILKEKGPKYYDFILMDIQMPIMNGYEATRTIRAMYPEMNAPIIALSANAFSEDRERSLAMGMDEHVSKPIKLKELLDALSLFAKER